MPVPTWTEESGPRPEMQISPHFGPDNRVLGVLSTSETRLLTNVG